jgi:glutathione S-transferase
LFPAAGSDRVVRREARMAFELFYWPSIQGRGEFIRLALEAAGAAYVDVARKRGKHGGVSAMQHLMQTGARPSFAPPFLRHGEMVVGQTANILLYLGPLLGLVPESEADRLWAHQLQLTIMDVVDEAHDSHHPISSGLYYEDQLPEARRRAEVFRTDRLPGLLGWLERLLAHNRAGHGHLLGGSLSYPDLSLFQLVAGLRYAFPRAMARLERRLPHCVALHDAVARLPPIAAYLESPRRIAFNNDGIFRQYPELDDAK